MKDIALIFRILYYVLVLPWWLCRKTLPEVCAMLGSARACRSEVARSRAIRYALFWTSLRIPTFTNYCLRRSLILYKFLKEFGVETTINVGVRLDERGRLRAHSWLTRDGAPYLDDPSVIGQFRTIYTFPPAETGA